MTCEEFRANRSFPNDPPADALAHLDLCATCRAWDRAEASLAADLRLVRGSAPQIPASLDQAIVNAFRRTVSEQSVIGFPKRGVAIGFAAIAAALIVGAILFLPRRIAHPGVWAPSIPSAPPVAHKAPAPPAVQAVSKATPKPVRHAKRPAAQMADAAPGRPQATERDAEPVAMDMTPPSGFQGLMYCDPLSCPGTMDVIRIQVPVSTINRVPVSRSANGFVQADVVVGSDGIARAIRIVR